MTYRELLNILQTEKENLGENMDRTITVKVGDEFLPVLDVETAQEDDNDILDEGHIFLVC